MKKRPLRFARNILALLAVVGLAVWASLPFLVSTDTVRVAIERELGRVAGMTVELGGPTRVALFPRQVATLSDVRFSVPGVEVPVLSVETLTVDIKGRSLLGGRPVFTAFGLTRPHFQPLVGSAGRIDWIKSAGRVGQRLEAQAAGQELPGTEPRLGNISIVNGRVTLPAGPSGAEEITAVNATANWRTLADPLSVAGDFIWRGTPANLRLDVAAPVDFMAGTPGALQLDLRSDVANLTFTGQANGGASHHGEGKLAFETPSMRALLQLFGSQITEGRALGKVALESPVKLTGSRLRFEKLAISVNENAGVGALEIAAATGDTVASVTGTLDFRTLDLSAFLGAFIALPRDSEPVVDLKSPALADLRISSKQASFGTLQLANLAATARVSKDAAIFDIGDATAYGGHVQARLQLRTDGASRNAEIILAGQNVDSLQVARDFPLPKVMPVGTGTFSVTLAAPMARWEDMALAATGKVSLEMRPGSMPGLGIKALEKAKANNRYVSMDTSSIGEPFDVASFNAEISAGLATLSKTQIAYPAGNIDLSGIISYDSGSLALTATVSGNPPSDPPASSYFFIGGSWDRPFAFPVISGTPELD